MIDILKHTNLSEDGSEIGETNISWIPKLLENLLNYEKSQDSTTQLIQLLPEDQRAFFLRDVLLTYPQFKRYHEDSRTHFTNNNQLDEQTRTYVRGYQNDYDGYLSYLENSSHHMKEFFFRWFKARLPLSQVHTYIVGASGSGKSEIMKNMIYDKMKNRQSAVIVIDPKGDLARQVARWQENWLNPDNLIYFDPLLFPDLTPVLNPLDIVDKSKGSLQVASFEMRETFDMILKDIEGGFSPRMKNILGHTLNIIMKKKGGSLTDLKRFFNNNTNDDLLKEGKLSEDEQERYFFNHEFADLNSETVAGISARLGLLLQNETFRNITTGVNTINLEKAIREKKLIVFNLSKGAVTRDYSKFFGKIVVSLVLLQAMQTANKIEDENHRPKIDLFIDEFQNYITPVVGEIVAEARAYGVRLTVATQLVGQDMSKSLEQLILTNTDTKAIGWSSIENRTAMAKQFGMTAEELETPKRTFWVRVADGSPFKTKTTSRLAGSNNAMSQSEWLEVLEHQKKYYTTKEKAQEKNTEAPPKDINQKQSFERTFKPKFDL